MAARPTATGTGWSTWFARAMTMDDATWERHANPWSVWTRMATLPLLLPALQRPLDRLVEPRADRSGASLGSGTIRSRRRNLAPLIRYKGMASATP